MKVSDFLLAVNEIVSESPTYRTGGTGKDGTCDCVGLLMGAMQRVEPGMCFPLHSSNYFARYRMNEIGPVPSITLTAGMAVYKAKSDISGLNARYRKGGSHFNGDLLDYYHVGVVTSTEPLVIAHCTSTSGINGIAIDRSAAGWTHAGKLSDVEFNEESEDMATEQKAALVHTEDGNPLKMRADPSREKPHIAKIPNGAAVAVLADAQGWAKVEWKGLTGYCMSKFLRYIALADGQPNQEVTITLSRPAAMELLDVLQKATK